MDETDSTKLFTKNAIEASIKIALIAIMVIWSFQLIRPFVTPVIWGMILAVALEPFIARIARAFGGRKSLTAILFVLVIVATLIIPTVVLVSSSIDTIQELTEKMQNGILIVPPPPAKIADWPVVGDSLHKAWSLASTNLEGALKLYAPQLKTASEALLSSVGGGLGGLFMVIVSTCIAGVFMAKAEPCSLFALKVITRFIGERGAEITSLATATIRGVMQGVVGVAAIQAVMSAIGMVLVGVPAAGLWTILVLVFAVAQLPPILVLGPVAAYVFSVSETTPAVIFLIWALIVSASDGVLKPLLMGRGVEIPMLVILIGALGGMMLSGIIGLFVGAVVLAIMYSLFMAWMEEDEKHKDQDVTG